MNSKNALIYLLIAGEVVILGLVLVLGVFKLMQGTQAADDFTKLPQQEGGAGQDPGAQGAEPSVEGQPQGEPDNIPTGAEPVTERTETFTEEIEAKIAAMTIEQKVAQLFLVSPEALTGTEAESVTVARTGTQNALRSYPVGGILYGSGNYLGTPQATELIGGAQRMNTELGNPGLFVGRLLGEDEVTAMIVAKPGQEQQMADLLAPNASLSQTAIGSFPQIAVCRSAERIADARGDGNVVCCQAADGNALSALQGGADMVFVSKGFPGAYDAVLSAAKSGELAVAAIDTAVGRILTKKQAVFG